MSHWSRKFHDDITHRLFDDLTVWTRLIQFIFIVFSSLVSCRMIKRIGEQRCKENILFLKPSPWRPSPLSETTRRGRKSSWKPRAAGFCGHIDSSCWAVCQNESSVSIPHSKELNDAVPEIIHAETWILYCVWVLAAV